MHCGRSREPSFPHSFVQDIPEQDQHACVTDDFSFAVAEQIQILHSTLVAEHQLRIHALQSDISLLQQRLADTENKSDTVEDIKVTSEDAKAVQPDLECNLVISSSEGETSTKNASNPVALGQMRSQKSIAETDTSPSSKNAWRYASMSKQQRVVLQSLHGVQKFVLSGTFEMLTGSVIVANTIMMAVELQYKGIDLGHTIRRPEYTEPASQVWPGAEEVFTVADYLFNSLFLLELLMRLYAFRFQAIRMPWMWFDSTVVALGVIDTATDGGGVGIDPTMARLVRLVRLVRLLKIFRSMSSFDSLFLLLKSITASVTALFWSFLLLLVVQVTSALFLSQVLQESIKYEVTDPEVQNEVFLYFGTFSRSMVTMFEITLANWVPTCRYLIENVNGAFFWFYLVYRCMFCFCVLKVVAAVFIAETNKVLASDTELTLMKSSREAQAFRSHLEKVLGEMDDDGDGVLTIQELQHFLMNEMSLLLSTVGLEKRDVQKICDIMQHQGNVSSENLVCCVLDLKGPAKKVDIERMEQKLDSLQNSLAVVNQRKNPMIGYGTSAQANRGNDLVWQSKSVDVEFKPNVPSDDPKDPDLIRI